MRSDEHGAALNTIKGGPDFRIPVTPDAQPRARSRNALRCQQVGAVHVVVDLVHVAVGAQAGP